MIEWFLYKVIITHSLLPWLPEDLSIDKYGCFQSTMNSFTTAYFKLLSPLSLLSYPYNIYVPFTEGDRHLSIVTSNNIVDNTGEMTSTIHPVLDDC